MSGQPVVSTPVRLRAFALFVGYFALILGPGCGRETFDLLAPGGAGGSMAGGSGAGGSGAGGLGAGGLGAGGSGAGGSGAAGLGGDAMANSGGGGHAPWPPPTGGSGGSGGSHAPDPSTLICGPTAPSCKYCQNQNDCGGRLPNCEPQSRACAACRDTPDCQANDQVCDPIFFRCEKTCQNNPECNNMQNNTRFCIHNVCAECRQDSDCGPTGGHSSPICYTGICVDCTRDDNCPQDKSSCQAFHCVTPL